MEKKPQILLIGLILLPAIIMLTSLNALCQNLTLPAENANLNLPSLNLELPEPLEINYNSTILYAWNIEGLSIITKIFVGYNLWAENELVIETLKATIKERQEICFKRLDEKDKHIKLLSDDRDNIYHLFNQERKDKAKLKRKNTIKIILISGSTCIVGAAVGLLIGFFSK